MENGAALLYSAIVPAADNLSVDHEHRANRDAALAQSFFGFSNRGAKESVTDWRLCKC